MKASIKTKLELLCERQEEVGHLLGDPDVIGDQNRFRELSKEYSELEPVVLVYQQYQQVAEDIQTAKEMLDSETDAELKEMAKEEIQDSQQLLASLEDQLQVLLLPKDPDDDKNVFLEIRAGTGGDEAAIFSGDLFRMYSRYAENMRWKVEVMSENQGDHGGFKEIVARVTGTDVYAKLKFESGAHRVQRVPETESQGRVHTSACTVAVLPEAPESEEIDINKADLRVDTFRASGSGGQHVNKTDSAIRLTHLPTGLVVECQDERSQHKNRAKAMAVLQARLNNIQRETAEQEQADARKSLVGSGDRSERIRTYNYPQGRLTEHRINLTLYKLADVMEGGLADVIDPLVLEYQADQLAALSEE